MVTQDKWFYFVGGKSAASIEELVNNLQDISNEDFTFHVNSSKNDIANWIEGVFKESDLANEMRHVMEKKDTLHILKRFLNRKIKDEKRVSEKSQTKLIAEAFEEEPVALRLDLEVSSDNNVNAADNTIELGSGKNTDTNTDFVEDAELDIYFEIEPEHPLATDNDDVPKFKALKERTLSEDELRNIVKGAKIAIDEEKKLKPEIHKFVVKEFIYGFVLGLIFGMIMSGILLNLRVM